MVFILARPEQTVDGGKVIFKGKVNEIVGRTDLPKNDGWHVGSRDGCADGRFDDCMDSCLEGNSDGKDEGVQINRDTGCRVG